MHDGYQPFAPARLETLIMAGIAAARGCRPVDPGPHPQAPAYQRLRELRCHADKLKNEF